MLESRLLSRAVENKDAPPMVQVVSAQSTGSRDLVAEIDGMLGFKATSKDDRTSFRIGDLAREFGVTLRTLRFYEDRGLLNPQRRGTTRLYTRRDRMRLRLIQLAKALGFSLTEAKQIIEIYDQPNGRERQLDVALSRMLEQKKVLEEQRQEIERSLRTMDATLALVQREVSRRKA